MAGHDRRDLCCGIRSGILQQFTTARLIAFGGSLAMSTILLSYAFHAYMSEVYPTRVRARARLVSSTPLAASPRSSAAL